MAISANSRFQGPYRAGYELLFTPVIPSQKRSTKALLDVGVTRLGDIVGSVVVQLALVAFAATALDAILVVAIAVSAAGVPAALRLRRGYVRALEKGLLSRAIQLDLDDVEDVVTRSTVMQSAATLGIPGVRPRSADEEWARPEPAERPPARPDPELQRLAELRSGDAARVRAALAGAPLPRALAGHVIPLLAWDEVMRDAIAALRGVAPHVTGQLIDHLLDPDEEFVIRRRVPIVLASCPTQRAAAGLLDGLDDPRFEVRYRCGRALDHVRDLNDGLVIRRERIVRIVLNEAAVDRRVWESHRLLDMMQDDEWSPVMDEALRARIESGYFDDLGVTAIWVSSVSMNTGRSGAGDFGPGAAYHSYWPISTGWRDDNQMPGVQPTDPHFGTLDEFFEIITLSQTRKLARPILILLYGSSYWNEIVNFHALVRHGMISNDDLSLFQFVDSPKEALKRLKVESEKKCPAPAKSCTIGRGAQV